ncbi:class I SAM-dependent RNA methyltransferase [Actibacterium ureilyticum]|uniref:class I SAM-dependent RNA methyltransferase n=1 Tax=Actibacterium ureilyticum TaxID=1590614 RepID=UPI000BAB12D8|nr:class I SAM-dependent RNA methyltransferase [Actibacterium ureilyticum]
MKLTIERLGHHGDGIAPGPVFVPRTLPDEVVEGAVEDGRMAQPSVVTPSPDRVRPPCPHFRGCGGCALQHASDVFVEAWKAAAVTAALMAQGLDVPIAGVVTSPPRSRRRAVLSGRRTKKGALVGFHARASDTIVAIPDCELLRPELIAAIPALEQMVVAGASRKGEVSITITLSEAGLDIAATGGKDMDRALFSALAGLAEQGDWARLSWNGDVVVTRKPPTQRFGPARVVPPPGAFLQATAHGQQVLTDAVLAAADGAVRVVDLFAGCGTFSLPLAQLAEVHAVEGSAEMTQALEQGWRQAQGLKAVTVAARDLFRRPLLPDELNRFDMAVLDPPRAGAEAQVDQIARSDLQKLVMVSCNPQSFARDARRLADAGFTPGPVTVVDQFRWSPHIELVCSFLR